MERFEDCKDSVFDPVFGEVKCRKRHLVLQNPKEDCELCGLYEKDKDRKSIDISKEHLMEADE